VDISYFLERRLAFIEQYYLTASAPFLERKRTIEAGEEPFIQPNIEEGEPPHLAEWLEADESLQVLGHTCISMLSASLHLYFTTWQNIQRMPIAPSQQSVFKKRGWFNGYKAYFKANFGIDFDKSACNLELMEELVLARNRVQHPESITSLSTDYSLEDMKKLSNPFFIDEREVELMVNVGDRERNWLIRPTLNITKEKLLTGIAEVRRFSFWIEASLKPN
jgi:hypothetical protein